MFILKKESERIKDLPVNEIAKMNELNYNSLSVVVTAIVVVIGLVIWCSFCDSSNSQLKSLGSVSIFLLGLVFYRIVAKILKMKYEDYNNIVRDAKKKEFQKAFEKKNQERIAIEKMKKESFKKAQNNYSSSLEKLNEVYGKPDRTIVLGNKYSLDEQIIIFGQSKHIILLGKDLHFEKLLTCKLEDDTNVKRGQLKATTKSGSGSMLGRALVGSVVAGEAGAIIGGATGEKNTTFSQEDDIITHDYTVLVNIQDLLNPIVRIRIGKDKVLADYIVCLINTAISMK